MVRAEVVRCFDDLCFVIEAEEVKTCTWGFVERANEHASRGLLHSSVHMLSLDKTAADACERAAKRIFDALIDVHGAEPNDASQEKAEELASMLVAKVDSVGRNLLAHRNDALTSSAARAGLSGSWFDRMTQFPTALSNARMTYAAKVRLAALGSQNRGTYAMTNTFHGPVGAFQSGPGATATITQNIAAPPTREVVLTALLDMRRAIENASARNPEAAREALEVVQELEVEAVKSKPNRVKVGALLQGASAAIRGIADAPRALETLNAWGHALGQAIPL